MENRRVNLSSHQFQLNFHEVYCALGEVVDFIMLYTARSEDAYIPLWIKEAKIQRGTCSMDFIPNARTRIHDEMSLNDIR